MSEVKTYSQMRKDFQEVFFKKLSPALVRFEAERQMKLLKASVLAGVLGAAGLFFSGLALYLLISKTEDVSNNAVDGIGQLAAFLFVLSWFFWYSIKKDFESKIKNRIMGSVCKCFGDLKWDCYLYMGTEIFRYINLIPAYTLSTYDDVFEGKYNDVGYEIIESKFTRRSGKKTVTVFDGVIVKLDMNKPFKGNTVVYPDTLMHSSPSPNLAHTVLEDTVFEKKFDVFTDDEVEARYLITPSFMERLNKMKIAFSADKVSCSFYDKYMFIALHTKKDLFSLCSLLKPVNDGKQFFTMFEEILSIIKLIDYFKLDQKIGM